jgi:hypothetical protein
VEAGQLVVYDDNGTPIMVAGAYGPPDCYKVAHAGDEDFQRVLDYFGVGQHKVVVENLQLDGPPSGARLLAGPHDP